MSQFIVGLTGGIGSGKTTVANLFAELGIVIIDADLIARQVVQPGTSALAKIIAHFGADLLKNDNQLDRQKLHSIIFTDAKQRKWLENLLHPLIRTQMTVQAAQAPSPYCIFVIPLLQETTPNENINRTLVVDIDEALQLFRVQQRDHLSSQQVENILNSQASRADRLAIADDIIYNHGSLAELREQVLVLHHLYLDMTAS